MIFPYVLADLIEAGEKTVTRRPCVSARGRTFNPPAVGDLLPIQRGYNKAAFSVRVTAVERQDGYSPDPLDNGEAHREGFTDAAAFVDAWVAIYGPEPISVYRIEFDPPAPASGRVEADGASVPPTPLPSKNNPTGAVSPSPTTPL